MTSFSGKRILVTGACGTIGSELIRQLLSDEEYQPREVIGLDNNESELFFIDHLYTKDDRARFALADMRDRDRLTLEMRGVDIVFHTAALKHVVMCERGPMEAVQTNILGVQNIIEAASVTQVGKVIFTSSDKAVNPTNVMGTSKLMGERLMTAANSSKNEGGTLFSSTRFGNVLGSRGSVVPIFIKQIADGGPVTITDPTMTRFIMGIKQAVKLVIESTHIAKGGEVFITKMPVIRIIDLANVLIDLLAPVYGHDPSSIEITEIGVKPGEKMYEELMNDEETRRAVDLKDYFAITPAFRGLYGNIDYRYEGMLSDQVTDPYNSKHQTPLNREDLIDFLESHELLEAPAA